MSAETKNSAQKRLLFVDDDARFLAAISALFSGMAQGSWEIFTAENHARALALLSQKRIDVVVLDIGMPVMDGIQFLQLLGRTYPGQQVVMLTGRANEETRKTCLEKGALLFLEKPVAGDGFAAVFAALDALAGAQPQSGFQGLMRRVGLQEVLQMECLGRKSSILEIFTAQARGRVFISDGTIIHSETGRLEGEAALYSLLALREGQFNLMPFVEPPRRTISGHYEFLLMEAARLSDESSGGGPETVSQSTTSRDAGTLDSAKSPEMSGAASSLGPVRIEEIVLCSGAGELLYDWGCHSRESRLRLLDQVERQATEFSNLMPVGFFDRLEIRTPDGRVMCQIQPDRRLFVRSASAENEVA